LIEKVLKKAVRPFRGVGSRQASKTLSEQTGGGEVVAKEGGLGKILCQRQVKD